MKKITTTTVIILLLMSFMSISAFAQKLDSGITNEEVESPSIHNEEGESSHYEAEDFTPSHISPPITNQGVNTSQNNTTETVDGIPDDFILSPNKIDSGVADDFEVPPNKIDNTPITHQGIHSGEGNTSGETLMPRQQLTEKWPDPDPAGLYEWDFDKSTPEIQSTIYDLEVKPSEIFSPVFSSIENLKVNPTIKDEKVVYSLVVEDESKPIFREKEVIQPIFDLRVDYPVEFKLVDNRIIVNNEQIIDYKNIVREKEVMPPIELEINSEIKDAKVYALSLLIGNKQHKEREHVSYFVWGPDTVKIMNNENVQDWEVRESGSMPIYSDFKVEDKKLYLLNNDKLYDLRINPPEIYSAIYDLRLEEPKIIVKELSLGIENEKAVYDLRVEQPAKLLWIIPWTVESKYLIDPTDGNTELVNSPWWISSERLTELYEWDFDYFI